METKKIVIGLGMGILIIVVTILMLPYAKQSKLSEESLMKIKGAEISLANDGLKNAAGI